MRRRSIVPLALRLARREQIGIDWPIGHEAGQYLLRLWTYVDHAITTLMRRFVVQRPIRPDLAARVDVDGAHNDQFSATRGRLELQSDQRPNLSRDKRPDCLDVHVDYGPLGVGFARCRAATFQPADSL